MTVAAMMVGSGTPRASTHTHAFAGTAKPPLKESAGSVVERVQRRLRESSYFYLRSISCACHEGVLTLRGRVPSFYLKQMLQVIAEKVEGVEQIVNQVEVCNPAGLS